MGPRLVYIVIAVRRSHIMSPNSFISIYIAHCSGATILHLYPRLFSSSSFSSCSFTSTFSYCFFFLLFFSLFFHLFSLLSFFLPLLSLCFLHQPLFLLLLLLIFLVVVVLLLLLLLLLYLLIPFLPLPFFSSSTGSISCNLVSKNIT